MRWTYKLDRTELAPTPTSTSPTAAFDNELPESASFRHVILECDDDLQHGKQGRKYSKPRGVIVPPTRHRGECNTKRIFPPSNISRLSATLRIATTQRVWQRGKPMTNSPKYLNERNSLSRRSRGGQDPPPAAHVPMNPPSRKDMLAPRIVAITERHSEHGNVASRR